MQKREGLRGRGRRMTLGWALVAGQALAAAMSAEAAASWGESPFRACSGARLAAGRDSARAADVFLSLANPYSIEGLVSSRLEGGIDGGAVAAVLDWRRLSHALYREDLLSCAAAVPLPLPGIIAGAELALLRRRAEGFPDERSSSFRVLAGIRRARSISATLALPLAESGSSAPGRCSWSCELSLGELAAGLSRSSPDGVETEYRIDMVAPLGERVAVRTAYAFRAGELACGVIVEIRRLLLGFSWSVNPSLGLSASAGIGRRWSW